MYNIQSLGGDNMPHILEWEFVEDCSHNSAQVIHYMDEFGQDFVPGEEGLLTSTKFVNDGNWKGTEWGEYKNMVPLDDPYLFMRTDHPVNGIVHGIARTNGDNLEYFRYQYMMDIGNIANDWKMSNTNDNFITDVSVNLQMIHNELYTAPKTMFLPGAVIDLWTQYGNESHIQMAKLFIDEIEYSINEKSVYVAARNQIGYKLADQTCDEFTHYEGTIKEIVNSILDHAGCAAAAVQDIEGTYTFDFEPSDSFLDALNTIGEYIMNEIIADDFIIAEQPGGALIFGSQDYLEQFIQNTYYFFHDEDEVFSRGSNKSADAAYSAIMVSGQGMDDEDLIPVKIPIRTWETWGDRKHKTCHIDAPCKMTQSGMQAWAESQATAYQLMGINESFEGPFRPQILVGDLATVEKNDTQMKMGIITQVQHSFSLTEGFKTSFTLDSGGVYTDESAVKVYSRTAKVNGQNRQQGIVDIMRLMIKQR